MLYAFRQLPIKGSETARPAAELAEFAGHAGDHFWLVHDELMRRGPDFADGELDEVASKYGLDLDDAGSAEGRSQASARVDEDRATARASAARATPTFL